MAPGRAVVRRAFGTVTPLRVLSRLESRCREGPATPGLWRLGPIAVSPVNPQTVPALKLPGLSTGTMRRASLECLATAIRRGIKVAGPNTGIKRLRKRRRSNDGGESHRSEQLLHDRSPF